MTQTTNAVRGVDTPNPYQREDFLGVKPFCDVVMKGGITSGIVYPLVVAELAKRYRLKNIGGASAGAIAAAFAAAAEFAREQDGYLKLCGVAEEVSGRISSLFQPSPRVRPIFEAAMGTLGGRTSVGKISGAVVRVCRGYPLTCVLGILPGALVAIAVAMASPYLLAVTIGIVLAGVGLLIAIAARILRVLTRELPRQGFGFCPGLRQAGESKPGLTDWLADEIDAVAGLPKRAERPLVFGDLMENGVNLEIVTTDLAAGRPHRIPFAYDIFMFRSDDLEKLFPRRIVHWMVEHSRQVNGFPGYRWLPDTEELPVVVAVRMSLSFPILLSAVPLYARDYTYDDRPEQQTPRRCWFSDGGICSNFPIHFFDAIWPRWPTFGITLERYDVAHGRDRVWLPKKAGEGIWRRLGSADSLAGFLAAILDTMQEWRDNLQSALPGYRSRIVRIGLDDNEGGLNLTMGPELVRNLIERGRQAGVLLRSEFDWDAHRWTRYVNAMAKLEEMLDQMSKGCKETPVGDVDLETFLAVYSENPEHYKQKSEWTAEARKRTSDLVSLSEDWRTRPLRQGNIPKPDLDLRMTPKV